MFTCTTQSIRRSFLVSLLLILVLALAACQPIQAGGDVPAESPQTPTPVPADAPAAGIAEADLPGAALNVRQAMAQQLGVNPTDIVVLEAEAVDWSDSCLGAGGPAEMCAQVITPGYRIVLEVNGEQYLVHTDADGNNYRLVDAPLPVVGEIILDWEGNTDFGDCQNVTYGSEAVSFAPCAAPNRMQGQLDFGDRAGELERMRATFAPFVYQSEPGTVTFNGTGSTEAAPSQQRMIAEWAQMVNIEVAAGRTSAANGLLFAVLQEGGIAALCSNVSVYLSGVAYVADCAGETPLNYPALQLDADQLARIYDWYDSIAPFEVERTDGTADTMVTRIVYSGRGLDEATEAQQQEIEGFAGELRAAAMAAGEPMPATPPAGEGQQGDADLSSCPTATAELALFASEAHGFCLLVPVSHLPVEYSAEGTVFVVDGDLMNSYDPRMDITVAAAPDVTAAMAADAYVTITHQSLPDWPVDRRELTLGGEPAVELRAMPGQELVRVIFVMHNGNQYSINLTPDDPQVDRYATMESLYTALVESFAFTR
jgi:hypothetical protein